ncbi:F-box domain-containing protein [Mycena venus]|uniref:F-box domain-containing protein n=1 Tax=Mycena venus TaxID=2733690 RepID=A0A8H7DET5_9AGAR|nr:F-box domain-containing protein [Mycena venus]
MDTELSPRVTRGRRRGLETLRRFPLFPRQPGLAGNPISSKAVAGAARSGIFLGISLPEDVLREIVEDLSPSDILNVSLTSKHVRILLIPELYKTVHLRSSRSCKSGLMMLALRPDLCAHIQKLAVRPNYYLAWPTRDVRLDEDWVAEKISVIAKTLTHLRTFDWDGLEMPRDGLWLTLRNSCPELKELFSNVGFQPFDPESELFKFSDLANFSLSVRHGLGDTDIFPSHEELPTQLWDMILNRCPNLTELTLCSFSASHRLFNIDRVTEGRWPELSSLTLGAFGYNSDFTLAVPPATAFTTFLAAHSSLSYLRLAWNFKRWMSPDIDDAMTLALPPALDTFSGIVQQLGPGCSSSLTSLDLMCEPLYAARAPALCTALRALPMLTSLELWVHVPNPRAGHEAFFRELWGAAPGLEDLHFMCTTAFGKKPLTELARALRLLPQLRTFALTKGHRYADESMRRSALRVFNVLLLRNPGAGAAAADSSQVTTSSSNFKSFVPRLTQVSIRWARAACRNHLKQEGTYERVIAPLPAPPPANTSAGQSTINSSDTRPRRRTREGSEGKGMKVEAWERGLRAVGGAFEREVSV